VLAAQDATPGLGEIECSCSTIVGRCPAMLMSETGQNGSVRARAARLFYPQVQTSSACSGMSVWCHDRKCGPQGIAPNVQGRRRCLELSPSSPQ
jgi:hypothetical protein